MRKVMVCLLPLLLMAIVFAQGMQPSGVEGNTLMLNTPKGLFVLRSGVLAKFDAATLKPVGAPFQLFGPVPARPADMNDREAMQKYLADFQRRNAPAIMIPKDNSLLLVIGDGFARISQDSLEVEAKSLLSSAPAAAADAGGFRMPDPAPGYTLVNNTLYLMRSQELVSVSITDGKVINRTPLPKELQTVQGNWWGGNRNGNNNRGGGPGGPGGGAPGGRPGGFGGNQ